MNGNGSVVFALLIALALTTAVAAQRREPFTGVVRDAAGQPLAGAQVVCTWSPDGIVLGTPDRRETKTDAEGSFALELWIGRAYCVWAIGPVDAERRRLVASPKFEAVGGRRLDLVADRLAPPARLQVRGTTPWINDGPLSLRVFVAAGASLPDLTIPGDGAVSLPPLPTSLLTVCLLDAKQQVLDSVAVDTDADATCRFADTHEVAFVVEDLNGTPVPGARILTRHGFHNQLTPRFATWGGYTATQRVLAVTDAEGKARGRIRDDGAENRFVTFTALTDTGSSQIAGYFGQRRIEDGKARDADEDEPFHCQVQPRSPRTVNVVGASDDLVLHGELRGSQFWRAFNAGGSVDWRAPLSLVGEAWTGNVPNQRPNPPYAWFTGDGTGSRPLRIVTGTAEDRIDLAALRSLAVQVVDTDGKPAAFVAVGVSHGLQGFPVHWTTHFVTDAQGRADLRMMSGACELFAVTAREYGYGPVAEGASETALRLRPLATARFRVVDADGEPVAGARLRSTEQVIPNDPIGRIVACGLGDLFAGVVSEADGLAVVRVPPEAESSGLVTASWCGKTSAKASMRCDRTEPVELQLPR